MKGTLMKIRRPMTAAAAAAMLLLGLTVPAQAVPRAPMGIDSVAALPRCAATTPKAITTRWPLP